MERNSSGQFILGSQARLTHGHSVCGTSPTYSSWASMMRRCDSPSVKSYPLYGGRGICVCLRWMKFENFLKDMGLKPRGMSLDRIDSTKNYLLSNCRWATDTQQVRNRSNTKLVKFRGRNRILAELVERHGVRAYRETWNCLKRGWSIEDALFKPKRNSR